MRKDLGAMAARLTRSLIAMERPILAAHEVSMWGYAVLSALRAEPARTQAALARTIGADKTRLIGVLDTLQQRGLIEREPDPADRRVHLLRLTAEGKRLHTSVQAEIRKAESKFLAGLPKPDRDAFVRSLELLSDGDQEPGAISG